MCRAVVLSLQGNFVTVEFLDFGCIKKIAVSNLKTLSIELSNRPRTVKKLTLSSVPITLRNPERAIVYLKHLMGNKNLIVSNLKTVDHSPISVHLSGNIVDVANMTSVSQQINTWDRQLEPELKGENFGSLKKVNLFIFRWQFLSFKLVVRAFSKYLTQLSAAKMSICLFWITAC